MSWFIVFCYFMFVYGFSIWFTQSIGPFYIFMRIRRFAKQMGTNTGILFRCMLCFPSNVGIVFSLFNWFFLPIRITPFNIIFDGTNLWWLAMIMDGAITGGICNLLWSLHDYINKISPVYEDEEFDILDN